MPADIFAKSSNFRLCVVNERLDQPDIALTQYGKLHAYLKKQLEGENIQVDKLIIADSVQDLVEKIRNGEVDAFIEGVMPTFDIQRKTGMVDSRLIAWRKGQRQYYSVFFVRKDSDINRLEDLAGNTLAFEAPRSTSAYYIPRLTLAEKGLKVLPAAQNGCTDSIQYIFAGSELNQAYWVQRGKVEAGAFNDGDWQRTPPQIRDQLRIIHQTPPVLRWLFSFQKNIEPHLQQTVTEVLIRMHETETGREALRQAERIARFEVLSVNDRESLDHWQKLLDRFEFKK